MISPCRPCYRGFEYDYTVQGGTPASDWYQYQVVDGMGAVPVLAVDHVIQGHLAPFDRSVVVTFSFHAGRFGPRQRRRVARCYLDRGWQFHWAKVAGYGIHSCACYGGGALVGERVVEDRACRSVER